MLALAHELGRVEQVARPLGVAGTRRQVPKAAAAARTARSASSGVALLTRPMTSVGQAGLVEAKVSSVVIFSPPMISG